MCYVILLKHSEVINKIKKTTDTFIDTFRLLIDIVESGTHKIEKIITLKQIRIEYDKCYELKIKFLSLLSKLKFNFFLKSDLIIPYQKSRSQKIVWNFFKLKESFKRSNTTKDILKFEQKVIDDKEDFVRVLNKYNN